MHQLWQHPNGNFYVLYGPRLKRRVSARTRNRGQAETFLAQFIAGASAPIVNEPTVGEILNGYATDAASRVRSVETLRFNCRELNRRLGALTPNQLVPAVIRGYAVTRGVAPGSVLREIGVLRAALGWAVEHQWITSKPIISNPVKAPKPRDRWLTKEEARQLIDASGEPHIRAFIVLGLMTAARTSAILEARWDQVDFERRLIDYGEGHGNKRRSVVPLNDEVLRVLLALRELACTPYLIEYHGRRVVAIKKGFKAACRRAALTGVSPHILRHTAATWAVMDGRPLREVARLLGDREETVERVYGKHSPDYLRATTGALQLNPEPAKTALQVKGGSPIERGNQSKIVEFPRA